MLADLWNIVLNLVASTIFAVIVWAWNKRGKTPTCRPSIKHAEIVRDRSLSDRRSRNLESADHIAYKLVFYITTFGVLYLSITAPPLFKALYYSGEVFLNSARYVGMYFPAIPIGKSYLQLVFFLAAVFIYFPLLFIAELLTSLICPLVDSFKEVTERIRVAIIMSVLLVFCIPVATTSVWLFHDKSYWESFISVLFFVAVPFMFIQAQSGRR